MRALALVVLLAAGMARADVEGASSRDFIIGFKLGPFRPLVDSATTSAYQDIFQSRFMLLGEVSFTWEFFQKLGSLGVGASAGYAELFSTAVLESTGQKLGMTVVPMKLFLDYRFDYLLQKYDIPVVPYVQAGLAVVHWNIVNPVPIVNPTSMEVQRSSAAFHPGRDLSMGFTGTLGVALALDFFDPKLARDFDTSIGINHTYLFVEGSLTEVRPLHVLKLDVTRTDYNLSSRNLMFGVAFEL